jgi:hypothetical protein
MTLTTQVILYDPLIIMTRAPPLGTHPGACAGAAAAASSVAGCATAATAAAVVAPGPAAAVQLKNGSWSSVAADGRVRTSREIINAMRRFALATAAHRAQN